MKLLKNILNENNKTKLIGILTILIFLWSVLYFIPELFVLLFNTLLGNLILLISTILIFTYNKTYGLIIFLICIILYRFSHLSREGFTEKSEEDFLKIQNTINKQKIFDMNIIKTQASQEELDYFNKNGQWPWSEKVIELYIDAIKSNPFIRTLPEDSVNYARTVYNENAILRVLSYQTKEGKFLLDGVLIKDPNSVEELPSGFGDYPYSSGLSKDKTYDIIKCNLIDDKQPTLERIKYTGQGKIFGEQTKETTSVDYMNLENIIPGFSFINKPCNPCKSMASIPDYSCPFELKVKDKSPFISNIWKYLWKIN